ncbi:MAG: SDR family NAD(P)-dependent oxidoreductase [Burkholderiales bacterium]
MELQGKVALITGAGQGIGEGIARRFVAEGARVVAVDMHAAQLAAIESSSGGSILGVVADVGTSTGIEAAFDAAIAKFGAIDILVNCAMVRANMSIEELDEKLIDQATGVGIKGLILCVRRAAREMRKRGGGTVINMSSFYTRTPAKERALYTAVKGAVEALTRALAVDLGADNIRVNAVAPGPILTPSREARGHGDPAKIEERYRKGPMGRFGRVEEVVEAVLFLATPRSSYMTGHIMALDGGLTIA